MNVPTVPGCTGKHQFTNVQDAKRAAQRSRRNRDSNAHAYRCRHCHHFHVGTFLRPKNRRNDYL